MEKEIEISVKDLFNTFVHGLWIMLTVAVVFAIVAFALGDQKNIYISTINVRECSAYVLF